LKIQATLLSLLLLLTGCAGPNPNIGERTTDYAWLSGRYSDAYKIVRSHAEAGEPWAQLRIAMFYENGWGVERNIPQAVQWYEKAAAQKAEGGWAEGRMIGALGRTGYFNQNSDARIAQRNLAVIYLTGKDIPKDLLKAYLNIRAVVDETNGNPVFFCCEFATPRYFSAQDIDAIYKDVLKEMKAEQKLEAEKIYSQLKQK
jgi:hypothetical protein